MSHEDALRELSVERYLLGELTGEARDQFEEHLFRCLACAEDLKTGMAMLEAARLELSTAAPVEATVKPRKPSWSFRWLLNPAWMVPALAACLAVVVYQSVFQVPRMKQQLAQSNTPEVLDSVVINGGAARGGGMATVAVPANGSFLLAVDIPPLSNYTAYLCSLASPSGKIVWKGQVTPEQAKDTVRIRVPASVTESGENTLTIQGVRAEDTREAAVETISTQRFVVEIRK